MTYASGNNFNQTVSLLAYRCLHRKACLIHRRYNETSIDEKIELYLLMHYMAFYNHYHKKLSNLFEFFVRQYFYLSAGLF